MTPPRLERHDSDDEVAYQVQLKLHGEAEQRRGWSDIDPDRQSDATTVAACCLLESLTCCWWPMLVAGGLTALVLWPFLN